MGIEIQDGTGKGYKVAVSEDGELQVTAINESEEHRAAVHGEAYYANTTDTANTLTQTATGGAMLYLRNNSSTKLLVVEKVLTSSNVAGGTVLWEINKTLGTIADHNTHVPVNSNASSGRVADALCYSWAETNDGLGGLTGGTKIKTFITGAGFTVHPIDGAIILGKNDSITVSYTRASACEFETGIRFYFDSFEG